MSSKSQAKHALTLFDPAILGQASVDAFKKLAPHHLAANPVIFVTEVVAALVTFLWARSLFTGHGGRRGFADAGGAQEGHKRRDDFSDENRPWRPDDAARVS